MSLILVVRVSRVWQKEWEERSRAHFKERMDVAAWMEGDLGGEWIHVYVWLGPFTLHLNLSQHCESAIP